MASVTKKKVTQEKQAKRTAFSRETNEKKTKAVLVRPEKPVVLEEAVEEELPKEHEAPAKKSRSVRRRRSRHVPRVPPLLRALPQWAEAWTALAESGLDQNTILRILRDASLVFQGLGELTPQAAEAIFRFWEVPEVPAGIESILEEAFLAQPAQAERKSLIEAFFRPAVHDADIHNALVFLWTARHVPDWEMASQSLRATGSPLAERQDLFQVAREIVS